METGMFTSMGFSYLRWWDGNYFNETPDEREKEIWNQPQTEILADRFAMLIAVICLEKGIEVVKEFQKKHNFFREIGKFKKKI